jgi:peptidoglycan-associated lipoprotein
MRQVVAFTALVALAGCAHKPQTKTETTAKPAAPPPVASTPPPAPSAGSCARDLDCPEGQLCVDGRCASIADNLALCTQVHIHFALNESLVPESEKPGLERAARCLKGDHGLTLKIEGNADERGTEEYNLALADKRAHAVAEYLRMLGASERQLKTISYGKENPICSEHDEACWAQNRRADVAANTSSTKKRHHK